MANVANIQSSIRAYLLTKTALTAKIGTRLYDLYKSGTTTTYPLMKMGLIHKQEPGEAGLLNVYFQFSIFTEDRDMMEAHEIENILRGILNAREKTTAIQPTGWVIFGISQYGDVRTHGIDQAGIAHVSVDYRVSCAET